MSDSIGPSGWLAKTFLQSQMTPLLALIGLLLGVFAVLVTPREEEPQIDVTFANVFIPFPGATAVEVEQVVSIPAEQVLSEIAGGCRPWPTSLNRETGASMRWGLKSNSTACSAEEIGLKGNG